MTKQEKHLQTFLEANASKRIYLTLRPEKGSNMIEKEPTNRCEVRFINSLSDDFTEFTEISERFYDDMVEEFHND